MILLNSIIQNFQKVVDQVGSPLVVDAMLEFRGGCVSALDMVRHP